MIAWLLCCYSQLLAHKPQLNASFPTGVKAGSEVEMNCYGQRLNKVRRVLFYKPGIQVKNIKVVRPQHVKIRVAVDPSAPTGEYPFRLLCDDGITYQRTIWVGPFPSVAEAKVNNNGLQNAQTLAMNVTVHGITEFEDVDYYKVSLKKGQRLSCEVEAMRLGRRLFDPYLAILDSKNYELASVDDTSLFKQDPYCSIIVPEDGDYYILVRDSAYEGDKNNRYRLHVGSFPRPSVPFPLALSPKKKTKVEMIYADGQKFSQVVEVSDASLRRYQVYPDLGGVKAPSAFNMRVSSLPSFREAEPNNSWKISIPKQAPSLPVAFDGVLSQPGDVDYFRFKGKKGQNVRLRVIARALGSPIDSSLGIRDSKGRYLAGNDDRRQGTPDSALSYTLPADGEYHVAIVDKLRRGGPDYVYRVELEKRKPSMRATFARMHRLDSQRQKTVLVPRGNRAAYRVNVARMNFNEDVKVSALQLPAGMRMHGGMVKKGVTDGLLMFEADPDAPLGGGLFKMEAAALGKSGVKAPVSETIEHIFVNNQGVYHGFTSEVISMAVIEESPVTVDLVTPVVPLVRNGWMDLKVRVHRAEGFAGPVRLSLLWKPGGIGAQSSIIVPKGKNEGVYRINANSSAALGDWPICVQAHVATKEGEVIVASPLRVLKVQEPMLGLKLSLAAGKQGERTVMTARLTGEKPLSQDVKVQLVGVPDGIKAHPVVLRAGQKEVEIPIDLAANARVSKYGGLYCRVEVPVANGVVYHQLGHGGTLRVDRKTKIEITAKRQPAKKAPPKKSAREPAKPKKPLSRLEQLRQGK